jgi:chromosome segregation ATPase
MDRYNKLKVEHQQLEVSFSQLKETLHAQEREIASLKTDLQSASKIQEQLQETGRRL